MSDNLVLDKNQKDIHQRLASLATQLASQTAEKSRGLYIWGPVGRGKTMLMDSFYRQLDDQAVSGKIRLHFHHFMARVHRELNELSGAENPLELIAKGWSEQFKVLCFDEFYVEDIADAMILGTLFKHLFTHNVVLVTTGNSPPEHLYPNGLQRQKFLPTIELLNTYCDVVHLDGGKDYRLQEGQLTHSPFYLVNGEPHELQELAEQHYREVDLGGAIGILGRDIPTLWSNDKVIGFTFEALCMGARSHRDYMELAQHYRAIAVQGIPQFSFIADKELVHGVEETYQREHQDLQVSKRDNDARRFLALVDECYERGCLILATAAVPIAKLYQAEQLTFAFARCESRLYEMQQWAPTTQLTPAVTPSSLRTPRPASPE